MLMSNTRPLVALFAHSMECGGVERITLNMARYLTSHGYRIDLLLRIATGEFLSDVPPGVRVHELGGSYFGTLYSLVKYLRRERPLNLLSFMYPQNELALLANYLAGSHTRTLVSIRSMLSGQDHIVQFRWPILSRIHTPIVMFLCRHTYARADIILAVSHGAAQDLATVTNIALSRIQVIYNPVIAPRLFALAEEPLQHPWFKDSHIPVILGVGRLHKIKNFALLIHAFALVYKQRVARLVILGTGPEERRLRDLVHALNLTDVVDMPGFVGNPYPFIRAATALVSTSHFEALPGVLIEALALGTPVVATDCPSGPREILREGRYGYLTPVGDSSALATAILRVLAGDIQQVDPTWLDQFTEETAMARYLELLLNPGVACMANHAG